MSDPRSPLISILPQGEALPGGYVIQKLIGQGGYGAVYQGHDSGLDRVVAIKVLTHTLRPQVTQRFRDEGRLLARLHHSHIVQVYHVGRLSNGLPFLVMEHFGSGSISAHWPLGERPSIELAVEVILQLLDGLSAAHKAGIVHRDLKEENLLYDPQMRLTKLCDFGIARSQDPLPDQAQTTKEGFVVGTSHYIAPERFKGGQDDPRTDLYSVGVILYRLLSGHRPYERYPKEPLTPESLLYRVFSEEVPLIVDAPPQLMRVCLMLLAKDPQQRIESADAAIDAIRYALTLPSTESAPIPIPTPSKESLSPPPKGVDTLSTLNALEAVSFGSRTLIWVYLGLIFGVVAWWLTPHEGHQRRSTTTSDDREHPLSREHKVTKEAPLIIQLGERPPQDAKRDPDIKKDQSQLASPGTPPSAERPRSTPKFKRSKATVRRKKNPKPPPPIKDKTSSKRGPFIFPTP
jgi:serine/threonine protein kinase